MVPYGCLCNFGLFCGCPYSKKPTICVLDQGPTFWVLPSAVGVQGFREKSSDFFWREAVGLCLPLGPVGVLLVVCV